MLLQPLVENAVKHGIEPEIGGGKIWIRGAVKGNRLSLEVIDTGPGFSENGSPGIGIDNVRERLRFLYGDNGRLILEENRPSGLKAIIEVPYETNQGNNSR
jgi:LytS/YehU family sensor histidine kinase